MTARVNFQIELEQLHDRLAEMGEHVENTIDQVFCAMEQRDSEQIEAMMNGDRLTDDMERGIEAKCLSLITRQQPVARDLRIVTATLKVVTDIERVGDQAVDIGELVLRNREYPLYHISEHMPELIREAKEMVHRAVDAFIKNDSHAAAEIIEMDDIVDDLFNKVKDDVVKLLREDSLNGHADTGTPDGLADAAKLHPDCLVDVLMIAKYLERIGDHAVNICEWEIFRETGAIDSVRLL